MGSAIQIGQGEHHEAIRLFRDFNFYREQTTRIQQVKAQRGFAAQYKLTNQRIEFFESLIGWCRNNQVDPRLWLYTLFRARRWYEPPALRNLNSAKKEFMSKKHLDKYEKLLESNVLDGYMKHIRKDVRPRDEFDPNKDILPRIEQVKDQLLMTQQSERCMLKMVDETFGYHPKSKVCGRCPIAVQCAQKLKGSVDFDIIALREGLITVQEALAEKRKRG